MNFAHNYGKNKKKIHILLEIYVLFLKTDVGAFTCMSCRYEFVVPGAGAGLRCRCRCRFKVPGAGAGAGQSQPAPQVPGAGAGLRCRVPVPV